MRTALITGITGQDGSHLADLLISKGYKVHGMVRRASTDNLFRIEHIQKGRYESHAKSAWLRRMIRRLRTR